MLNVFNLVNEKSSEYLLPNNRTLEKVCFAGQHIYLLVTAQLKFEVLESRDQSFVKYFDYDHAKLNGSEKKGPTSLLLTLMAEDNQIIDFFVRPEEGNHRLMTIIA